MSDLGDGDNIQTTRRIALYCAGIAVVVAIVPTAFALAHGSWYPSALVDMSETEPLAALARASDGDFRFVHPEAHYDGVYFFAIAIDPLATEQAHELVDKAAARYSHPAYGWMAALLTLGRDSAVPAILLLLALAGAAASGYLTSVLVAELGGSPWWGLATAFNPGVIYSVTSLTSEPVGTALLALGLLMWMRGRFVIAAATFVVLCFTKDPYVLVPVALAAWELLIWWRRRDRDVVMRVALLAPGPLLLIAWYAYLTNALGQSPFAAGEGLLAFPLRGWIETLRIAAADATGPFLSMQIGAASLAIVAAVGALILAALLSATRLRNPVDPAFISQAVIVLMLGPLALLYSKDLIRSLVPVTFLLPM
ncbi:MAG: hypothetical protein M3161_03970, partial [Actinomycetota bacterium]|nr:hypothetical protein [Actinomycetota bacterium]